MERNEDPSRGGGTDSQVDREERRARPKEGKEEKVREVQEEVSNSSWWPNRTPWGRAVFDTIDFALACHINIDGMVAHWMPKPAAQIRLCNGRVPFWC
jgi:hypothetical protein